MSPSPSWFHQEILVNLADIFLHYLRKNPIGKIIFAPLDTYLTDLNVYQPDLLFVSNERKSIIKEDGLEGAPDFVIEILSPRTAKYDRGAKRGIYAQTGVQELWIVDPESKTIQVFRLAQSAEVPVATCGAAQEFISPIFPGLTVSVADVFRR